MTPWRPCSASRSSETSSADARRGRAAGRRLPAARRRRPPGAADPPAVRQDGGRQQLRLLAPSWYARQGYVVVVQDTRGRYRPTASSRPSSTRPRTATTRSSGRPRCPEQRARRHVRLLLSRTDRAARRGRAAALARDDLPRLHRRRRRTRAGPGTRGRSRSRSPLPGQPSSRSNGTAGGGRGRPGASCRGARRGARPVLGAAVRRLAARARAARAVPLGVARPSDATTTTGGASASTRTTAACACPRCTSAAGTTRS